MFIIGIIAGALAVLASVVGFVIITIGLWKSFARSTFNRLIYLGLALISTAAIIFALSGPIFVGGLIFDIANNQDDDPVASAPMSDEPETVVDEETVYVEGDDDIPVDSSFVLPENLTEEARTQSNGSYNAICIQSDNAADFFYATTGLEGPADAYLVPINPDSVFVVSPSNDGPVIMYVNSYEYAIASANDTAYEYSYIPFPEDLGLGLDPIDTESEAYQVAEGCVS